MIKNAEKKREAWVFIISLRIAIFAISCVSAVGAWTEYKFISAAVDDDELSTEVHFGRNFMACKFFLDAASCITGLLASVRRHRLRLKASWAFFVLRLAMIALLICILAFDHPKKPVHIEDFLLDSEQLPGLLSAQQDIQSFRLGVGIGVVIQSCFAYVSHAWLIKLKRQANSTSGTLPTYFCESPVPDVGKTLPYYGNLPLRGTPEKMRPRKISNGGSDEQQQQQQTILGSGAVSHHQQERFNI